MFAADGEVLMPSEFMYKKPILVERGSFRPVCNVNLDMLRCAYEKFSQLPSVQGKEVIQVMEVTMSNLKAGGEIDLRDFLARADVMSACGMPVLISDYSEYYRLAAYLSRYTKESIAITMGAGSLQELFDEKYYTALEGGVLESFGRLFKNDLKIYCYPLLNQTTGELMTCDNLQIAPDLRKLYGYLLDRGGINALDNYSNECLRIFSREILKKIKSGDASWETMVPVAVADIIKNKSYFGYEAKQKE
jgi:hypothetical protein